MESEESHNQLWALVQGLPTLCDQPREYLNNPMVHRTQKFPWSRIPGNVQTPLESGFAALRLIVSSTRFSMVQTREDKTTGAHLGT